MSEQRMNPEIKARWVAALRSGEYKQHRQNLKSGTGAFCCLGVLCDLHAKETGTNWEPGEHYMGHYFSLPSAVADWAGAFVDAAPVQVGHTSETLPNHNDTGASFTELADAIEEQL